VLSSRPTRPSRSLAIHSLPFICSYLAASVPSRPPSPRITRCASGSLGAGRTRFAAYTSQSTECEGLVLRSALLPPAVGSRSYRVGDRQRSIVCRLRDVNRPRSGSIYWWVSFVGSAYPDVVELVRPINRPATAYLIPDIVVRVRASSSGSRINNRSLRRQGRSDFGFNAARILI
jgi:hypothetical protein